MDELPAAPPAPPGDVLAPIADTFVPADAARAAGRVRNLALLGAALPWMLPATPVLATAERGDVVRASCAFGAAAIAAHLVRRRPRACVLAAAAAAVAGAVAGPAPRPWAMVLGGAAAVLALATALRLRAGHAEAPREPQHGLAGIAWTVLWTLVVREFAILPIHVPTGSMQPAIWGAGPLTSGDRLLVDRPRYVVGDPRRWDVGVFEYPLHRPTTFVKRVIGLPGETVEIRDGDVWIDGRVARKPDLVQETMWREVFPRPNLLAVPLRMGDAWRAADRDGGGWATEGAGVRCVRPAGAAPSALRFVRSLPTADVRVRFALAAGAGGAAAVRVRSAGRVVEFAFGGDAVSEVEIRADGATVARTADGGPPDEVAVADGAAVARRRGREILRADVPPGSPRQAGIELVGVRGDVAFGALRVDRDQVWRAAGDRTSRWDVPEGSYFVLGDNSEQSEDSREWRLTEISVRGRSEPWRVAPTYPGDTGAPVRNLAAGGGDLVFRDADGVPHRVRRADVESRRDGVAAPFVPRSHFLGRVGLVYWSMDGDGRTFRPRFVP